MRRRAGFDSQADGSPDSATTGTFGDLRKRGGNVRKGPSSEIIRITLLSRQHPLSIR